jgi:pimeloyl-ACP methyl ester carboxylesterase
MIKTISVLLVITLLAAGCTNSSREQLTGCDHYSGWCDQIRELAAHSWKYAQLSNNVYEGKPRYEVSTHFEQLEVFEDGRFYAELNRDRSDGTMVLVYRGTDQLMDFWDGNNPFNPAQNRIGLDIFDKVREKYGNGDYIVAGHSLGGGIATHVSLNRDKVKSYSFDGSPVFRRGSNYYDNERYSIVEYGELLKFPRIFGREATQLYTSIGCVDGESPLDQHSIRTLATCLTQIAATASKEALNSLELNKIDFIYSE